ncbi:YbaK/EbsC family protein [Mangrovicoccus algicola]|uniref:YbaK/EbsC family protein n=1 Tax=Mangrovicoccus algicola TaxID=2771008 RepID=A0A8J6Z2B2_9RHOB|nr:YbaK/EbsC family protein [Mangrovicoccus algicola]
MSRSLKRVMAALAAAGLDPPVREFPEGTRTAQAAADAVGCALDQIAKSILFRGAASGQALLFVTAGGNRVCPARAAALAGEDLAGADAAWVRAQTGFAIGGVAPVGHLQPPRAFWDPRLAEFDEIWAAAGTPRHVFSIAPADLLQISGARRGEFTETAR